MNTRVSSLSLWSFQQHIENKVHHTLSSSHNSKLADQLYKLSSYKSYRALQLKHVNRLREEYLSHLTDSEKLTYQYLFSHHKKSSIKLKQSIVRKLVSRELDSNVINFLATHWFVTAKSQKPPLSELARVVSEKYIQPICHQLEPNQPESCEQSLKKIKSYQKHDKTLQKLEETIIPIDSKHYEQTIRQLEYLSQNPNHIGAEALRLLSRIHHELKEDGHKNLISKVNEIKSIIALLRTPNGQYILQKIKSLHTLHHDIKDVSDAYQILQNAYISERHPLREIILIQNNLAPFQAKWLDDMTSHLLKDISNQANQFLKENWNHEIYPEISKLQSMYPFSNSSNKSSAKTVYETFQLIDCFFDRFIRTFVQEEDGELIIKPYGLNIDIPDHILTLYIYTKIIHSCLDIKSDHLHAAWAINIKSMPHPISSITLHAANKKIPLEANKASVLHWDSRYPIGFDVTLLNGETITLVQNHDWSMMDLFSKFQTISAQCYQYQSPNKNFKFSIELKPQYPIDLLNTDLLHQIPFSSWQ
jgi:hypothetical protein